MRGTEQAGEAGDRKSVSGGFGPADRAIASPSTTLTDDQKSSKSPKNEDSVVLRGKDRAAERGDRKGVSQVMPAVRLRRKGKPPAAVSPES